MVELDLIGERFGLLLVIDRTEKRKNRSVVWRCKCDCGNWSEVTSDCLRRGKTKSCGCRKDLIRKRKPYKDASLNALICKYKHKARKKKIPFELSKEEFRNITSKNCFYCGVEPKQFDKNSGNFGIYVYNGIDRIDNEEGYVLDNCVPCCKTCNYAKNTLSINDFMAWIEQLVNYRNSLK